MASEPTSEPEVVAKEILIDPTKQIVQYILVRGDIKWNSGAIIAQACHACIASIVTTMTQEATQAYLEDLTNMHKIVLKADSLEQLKEYESTLKSQNIAHHLWIEKPENVATCLAVSPQPRHLLRDIFKHLKLLKW